MSQANFTLTQFADHSPGFSHDAVKRYLQGDKLTANQVWKHSKRDVVACVRSCIVFDDSILDKNYSHHIGVEST